MKVSFCPNKHALILKEQQPISPVRIYAH